MFQIISDGGCDFSKTEAKSHKVEVVPFYITFDGETHMREGIDITKEAYFKRLIEDKTLFPKTAQPSPQDYIDVFTPYLEAGKDLVVLTISSKLSGSHNSATLAAGMALEDYPNRKIIILDSKSVAMGQALILREIIKMRDNGLSIDKTVNIAGEVIQSSKIYFTLDTLEYLKRGGRVGPTTAFVGGILNLRPILHLENGEVVQLDNVRGKKRALSLMVEGVAAVLQGDMQNLEVSIGHIFNELDANAFRANLEASLNQKINSPLAEVGATIGTHAGPGAIAIAYCRKYEFFAANQLKKGA